MHLKLSLKQELLLRQAELHKRLRAIETGDWQIVMNAWEKQLRPVVKQRSDNVMLAVITKATRDELAKIEHRLDNLLDDLSDDVDLN